MRKEKLITEVSRMLERLDYTTVSAVNHVIKRMTEEAEEHRSIIRVIVGGMDER